MYMFICTNRFDLLANPYKINAFKNKCIYLNAQIDLINVSRKQLYTMLYATGCDISNALCLSGTKLKPFDCPFFFEHECITTG